MRSVQIATPEGEFGCEILMTISTDMQQNTEAYGKRLLKDLRAGNQPTHIRDNTGDVVGLGTYIF